MVFWWETLENYFKTSERWYFMRERLLNAIDSLFIDPDVPFIIFYEFISDCRDCRIIDFETFYFLASSAIYVS